MRVFLKSKARNCLAEGEFLEQAFTVCKGSKISEKISNAKLSPLVKSYREDKSIVKNNILLKDITFKSSSIAGQFVLGDSVNGLRVWKDENGDSIKKYEIFSKNKKKR